MNIIDVTHNKKVNTSSKKLISNQKMITKNAILVVNKSDLIKGKLNSIFKKYDHVLISIKKDLNLNKQIKKIKNTKIYLETKLNN